MVLGADLANDATIVTSEEPLSFATKNASLSTPSLEVNEPNTELSSDNEIIPIDKQFA